MANKFFDRQEGELIKPVFCFRVILEWSDKLNIFIESF